MFSEHKAIVSWVEKFKDFKKQNLKKILSTEKALRIASGFKIIPLFGKGNEFPYASVN